MVERTFIGTWEVTNCVLNNLERCTASKNDLNGIKFTLGENGDVNWNVPEELKFVPLFHCESYEYHIRTGGPKKSSCIDLRFGAYAGQIFEFKVFNIKPKKRIILTSDDLCEMDCIHVDEPSDLDSYDAPYTLLAALEDGYFSDITITASNNKLFKVHSAILCLLGSDIDWLSDPPPFSHIEENVLQTILHYLYMECLPENLPNSTARDTINIASRYKSLEGLVESCREYIKRIQLKDEILKIVSDAHSCMDQIIEYINPNNKYSLRQDNIAASPSKLYYAIKQSFREEIVTILKFILLCDIFTKKVNKLSSEEQDEIMLLLKSKVPIYNNQFRRFLEGLKKIYRSMSATQRIEVASFIVPEIQATVDAVISLIEKVDKTLQQIVQGFNTRTSRIPLRPEENISSRLTRIIHKMEFNIVISVHENVKMVLEALIHKKEMYSNLNPAEKVQVIGRSLDFFIKELPIFLIRLDELVDVFDEKLELNEFKFFFKVETSKIAYILEKLREHLDISQDIMTHACKLVERTSFNQTLQSLGLLDKPLSINQQSHPTQKSASTSDSKSESAPEINLNLVKSLCIPPNAINSNLAKKCLQLLYDEVNTDMEFEVVCTNENRDNIETPGATVSRKCVIKAHRVIVAARCDWFRRALQSGMREAIDKKIIIHDTNPALFRLLLEYLYSGQLKQTQFSSEKLLELVLLSDRYEIDSLKQICEYHLRSTIDAESALYFLCIADRYNAKILKSKCINFISQHNEITESEEFLDLPISLQAEIFDTVWTQPKSGEVFFCNATDDVNFTDDVFIFNSNTSSQEELLTNHTSTRLEGCIMQLRNIIGDSAPRSYLVQIILAADYNLHRAVNFYYSDNS
ncbi:uncharacterized protein LOC132704030 [Cylas formicarius]|uniref:uncharacterized protein LOC132704030 n=1 Tax=Cylas formicarius TaxID=197179 RepID=UPI002958601A|nr:uncharacterized protein LOC132704030 [Cylas formicarius]XP_060529628.1 uncharacterized protein LOC132704030 [Cylas formicarius]XP_060529629.1 uncharacterized protein LOC132704030 [Cylas formicarius]